MDMDFFKYEPLQSKSESRPIRLLLLFPAEAFDEEIRCELFHTTIEANADFEALSYTWGDEKELLTICLNAKRHNITKNLDTALRHLRDNDSIRTLWVDALSINQRDTKEKTQQVKHMRSIYTKGGA